MYGELQYNFWPFIATWFIFIQQNRIGLKILKYVIVTRNYNEKNIEIFASPANFNVYILKSTPNPDLKPPLNRHFARLFTTRQVQSLLYRLQEWNVPRYHRPALQKYTFWSPSRLRCPFEIARGANSSEVCEGILNSFTWRLNAGIESNDF